MITRFQAIGGLDRHVIGWRPEAADHRVRSMMGTPLSVGSPLQASAYGFPKRVDHRPQWTPIKDQGTVGDCVCNGVCECYEFFQSTAAKRPMSRLYLYGHGRMEEGTPLDEDSGMQVGTGVRLLSARGVPFEDEYDYQGYETKFKQVPPPELDASAAQHKALFWYPVPDLFTLWASIAQGFPAVFGTRCPENMFEAECLQSGKIAYPEKGEGYKGAHCMGIAGYDDDIEIGQEKGALILPNSWGLGVGEQGYFFLPYRFVYEGIASAMYSVRRVQI